MPRKRKGDGDGIDEVPLKKAKCPPPRNRASPSSLLLACKDMNDDRKGAIDDMDLTSLRNIQCDHLFNNLSVWLADLYDPNSREVVVPGRGRLPVNEEYVHRVMGVPRGGNDVPYNLPSETDIELGLELFGELGYAPKMTDLVDLIKGSENSDDTFKRMWLLLAGNIVIAPTTSNKVSPRWYAVLRDINGVRNLNWSKFIADELHKALLKCKPTRGCLLFYNLLYIHVIDLSGHGIELPDGPFPINVWTKKLITLVLNKDVQADKVSFGKLPPEFGMNFCLFDGLEGLDKFMRIHTAPSCSEEKFDKSTQIVARFTSAMAGILGNLVESFTALDDEGHSHASRQLDAGLNVISSAARTTSRTTRSSQGRRTESAGKNVAEDSDSDDDYHGGDDSDSDADSDDDDDDYGVVRRRPKDPFVASGSGTVDVDMGSGPADDETTHLDGATVKAHDGTGPNVEDTPVRPVGDNLIESQILLTGTSHAASIESEAQEVEATITPPPFSFTNCAITPPRPTSPVVPASPSQRPSSPIALSASEIHEAVKKVVVQELGIRVAEKGTGASVPLSTLRKEAPRRAPGKQSVAAKDSGIAPVKSAPMKQVAAAEGSPSVPGKSRSKDKSAVQKVKFAKTRSSPRLRATLSQTTSSETTEVIHLEESPTATSPSEKAATSSEGASDAVAATSAGVSDDAVFQLAATATVTTAVEDIASVAVAIECEDEVVPNIAHDGSEAEKVVGSTRDNMPTDTATAGGEKNDADNPVVTVADPALKLSTPGAGNYDGNFTPPSCSLGLDAIFGASPQVPPSTEATATAQAAPTLAQVPPAAPEAPAAAPSAQVPPAAPEAPVAAPSAQVPPAEPATGPDAVLGLAAPVDAYSKGKAMMKVTKAQPVAWAPPPNNSGK
ncbi:hypothetical protein VPH35_074620 [Triticum aestivum]